jgi:hypothetical protein
LLPMNPMPPVTSSRSGSETPGDEPALIGG